MKLVYCITRSDTIGGAHVHVMDMASWMRGQGHDATVVVGGEGRYCSELHKRGIPYISSSHLCRPISLREDMLALVELRRIFRGLAPDLISLHSAKAGLVGRVAAMGLASAVVFTAHGWSFTEGVSRNRAAVFRLLERMASGLADRIITVSDYDRRLALDAGVSRAGQIVTIHNGMPDAGARAHVDQKHKTTRIVMVARLDEQKDHKTLFLALSALRSQSWMLELVGDGPRWAEIRRGARELGIEDRVRFLGLRTDVAEILAHAHLFVLTTNWEGFPRSILEAMRAALPVIATDVGGVSESLRDGETGFLVQRSDPEALRLRLAYLLDRPDERLRLGLAGRVRFEQLFTFDRMAVETLAMYREIIGDVG